LEKSGVLPLQTAKIKGFVPIGRCDLASLYDESLPPGLVARVTRTEGTVVSA
jgi:hypothetical protein